MKQLTKAVTYRTFATIFLLALVQAITWAQDSSGSSKESSSTTSVTTETTTWYTEPWVWIVGGAVLLLLIIALVRSGGDRTNTGRTDKVTVTKRTETDL